MEITTKFDAFEVATAVIATSLLLIALYTIKFRVDKREDVEH